MSPHAAWHHQGLTVGYELGTSLQLHVNQTRHALGGRPLRAGKQTFEPVAERRREGPKTAIRI